jgi:uncharacterized repeat protein (TIGR04138 family)
MNEGPTKSLEEVVREDGRYPERAFAFLNEGYVQAVHEIHGDPPPKAEGADRHITGQQWCLFLRDLARKRWGMMARTVLQSWNIHGTIDFGHMVYLQIERGFFHKTDEDSLEDFRDVYDFDQAFAVNGEFELKE